MEPAFARAPGRRRPPFPRRAGALLLALALLAGCASQGARSDNDPLEPLNRKLFSFNLKAQKYALDPIARVWHRVLPDPVERSIDRFFVNLAFPIDFLNNLLQGKPRRALVQTSRFVVNSTVGLAGFLDPASHWGIASYPEDFGQTLGTWGLGPGPYLMLPLWGPSNVRESFGLVGDTYGSLQPFLLDARVSYALYGTNTVNAEGLDLEAAEQRRAAAVDYYVFVRDGYFQRRQAQVRDTYQVLEADADDLYYVDDDEP